RFPAPEHILDFVHGPASGKGLTPPAPRGKLSQSPLHFSTLIRELVDLRLYQRTLIVVRRPRKLLLKPCKPSPVLGQIGPDIALQGALFAEPRRDQPPRSVLARCRQSA